MTLLTEIKSVNWQLGLNAVGDVVEGIADIRQCIALIIITSKGSDPLRPEFGTNIYKLVDKPVNVAAPQILAEITQGIQLWEPRVRLKSILYEIEGEKLYFDMTIQLIINGQSAQLLFELDRQRRVQQQNTDDRAFGRGFSLGFR